MIQALLVAVVAFLASIDEQTFGACNDVQTVVYRSDCGVDHGGRDNRYYYWSIT